MSQKKEILHYLENGHALTSREATIKFGCTRLAARIAEIKEDGYFIDTEMVRVPTRNQDTTVAQYSMLKLKEFKHG